MAIVDFYPHSEVTVEDGTAVNIFQEEELPLFRPHLLMPAQMGKPNVPVWYGTYAEAVNALGAETFNEANTKYFSPACDLLLDIFKNNGAYITRACGSDALPAISLICMAIKINQDIPQWEIDPITGNYKLVTVNTVVTLTSSVALNATSLAVTALTGVIPANTTLNFGTAGAPKLVQVTAQANAGATSITISAATTTITSGSAATRTSIEKVPVMTTDATPVQLTNKGATVRYLALNDLVSIAEALDHTYVATTDLAKLQEVLAILTAPDFTANPLSGTTEAVIIPVLLVMAKTPGEYGNDLGFTLDYDKKSNSSVAVGKRNGFIYNVSPFKKNYGTNNTVAIKSIFGTDAFQAAMVPECIDSSTKIKYDLRSVVTQSYPERTNNIMMDFYPIAPNINLLAATLAPYEESIPDLNFKFYEADGSPVATIDATALQVAIDSYQYAGMFNMFGLRDATGKIYSNIIPLATNDEAGFFNIGTGRYLSLGTDGNIFDKATFQTFFTNFYDLQITPEIEDEPRYPFTHLIDVGYAPENKYDLLDFMAVRQDVKVDVGVYVHPKYDMDPKADGVKTAAEDISFGESLRSRALLTRECVIKGTNTCRASVFALAGYKPKQRYPVGLQNWLAIQRSKFHNKTFLDKEISGLPNSEVDIFERMVWIPSTKALKELAWKTGLNYCQYFDRTRYHCPSLRTVFDNDTSVLSDCNFVDVLIYTKHVVRNTWAKYAGVTTPSAILQPQLAKDVSRRLSTLYNNKYKFEVKAYQTEADNAMGFVQRIQIKIYSGGTFRVGIFDIICNRA